MKTKNSTACGSRYRYGSSGLPSIRGRRPPRRAGLSVTPGLGAGATAALSVDGPLIGTSYSPCGRPDAAGTPTGGARTGLRQAEEPFLDRGGRLSHALRQRLVGGRPVERGLEGSVPGTAELRQEREAGE